VRAGRGGEEKGGERHGEVRARSAPKLKLAPPSYFPGAGADY